MVNNSTNINKTNDHLSTLNSLNARKLTTYDVRNPGPVLGQVRSYDVRNPGSGLGQVRYVAVLIT